MFHWFPNEQQAALDVIKTIGEYKLRISVLIILGQQGSREMEIVQLSIADHAKDAANTTWYIKSVAELNDPKALFGELRIDLPPVSLALPKDSRDIALKGFIELAGEDRLRLTIQKFFPFAGKGYVFAVDGGWSGAQLCRLQIDNEPGKEYFSGCFQIGRHISNS